jgi:hypothetical protein
MSWKDMIPPAVKDAIFEEEPDSKKPTAKPGHPQPQIPVPFQDPFAIPATAPSVPTSTPAISIDAGADPDSISVFADRLKAKTDFDATPVGQQVNEHLAPLEGLPLTEMQKMSAVLKGGAKEGLTGEKIIATLQSLLGVLNAEQRTFAQSVAAATATEVETREKAIQDEVARAKSLEEQISASRQKQTDLSAELIAAQTNIERRKAQFKAALDARTAELQTTINHYQSILQGN